MRPRLAGEDFETVARIATGFGGKIKCRKQKAGQVSAGIFRAGLRGITSNISMDTGQQPLHQKDGIHYIKPIQLMSVGFSKCDPTVEKKLTAHPNLPKYAVTRGNWRRSSEIQKAVGDWVNVAFYWLLCVREYTAKQQTRIEKENENKAVPSQGLLLL